MTGKSVQVKDFTIHEVVIPIEGISPLIIHAWSEKAKREMLYNQTGGAKNKKHEIKVPEDDFQQAKHVSSQGWEGFPAAGFKAAMTRAAKALGMVMKDTQMAFFVQADDEETQLIRINGEATMRQDMVRVGMGQPDIRFRPEYKQWSADLRITFNAGVISINQVYQLVKAAGMFCGVGEMRPEKTKFNHGRFKLAQETEAAVKEVA